MSASEKLVDILSAGSSSSALVEEVEEANEMLILMQLEQGDASAADAATVMLQISREIETELAA